MFSFPSSPTPNQIIAGPDGQWFQWDGIRWVLVGLPDSDPEFEGTLAGPRFIKNPDKPIGEYGVGGSWFGGTGGGATLAPPLGFLRFGDLIIRWGGATGGTGAGNAHYSVWAPAHSGPLGWYAFRRLSGTRYDTLSVGDDILRGRFLWMLYNDGGPGAQMMWIAIGLV